MTVDVLKINDLDRMLYEVVRFGRVKEVHPDGTVDVQIGQGILPNLHVVCTRAGSNGRQWWMPAVGEAVLVFSPLENPMASVVWGSLYYGEQNETNSQGVPPGATNEIFQILFPDGTCWRYNYKTHQGSLFVKNGEQNIMNMSIDPEKGLEVAVGDKASLTISKEGNISIHVSQAVNVEAQTINLKAETINLKATQVNVDN
jgi:phage baseplate assembly protein V